MIKQSRLCFCILKSYRATGYLLSLCHFVIIVWQFNCGNYFTSDFCEENSNMMGSLDFPIQMGCDAILCVSNFLKVIGEWITASFHNEFAFHLCICIQETTYNNPLTVWVVQWLFCCLCSSHDCSWMNNGSKCEMYFLAWWIVIFLLSKRIVKCYNCISYPWVFPISSSWSWNALLGSSLQESAKLLWDGAACLCAVWCRTWA